MGPENSGRIVAYIGGQPIRIGAKIKELPPEVYMMDIPGVAAWAGVLMTREKEGRTAHIFDAPDDGLTAYLFQKAAEWKKWDKKALQDAISSIEDALDTVRGLEY